VLGCKMSQRLELRRWCKAVNTFGLGRGTNAYFFLALPDQICRGEREADAHVPAYRSRFGCARRQPTGIGAHELMA
jgi:hypothetical protein